MGVVSSSVFGSVWFHSGEMAKSTSSLADCCGLPALIGFGLDEGGGCVNQGSSMLLLLTLGTVEIRISNLLLQSMMSPTLRSSSLRLLNEVI